jgi:hypothetical protein
MRTRLIPIFLLCFALEAQTPSARIDDTVGRQTGPFLFSITSDRENYAADETITITSELRNVSDHDVTITMASTLQMYAMNITLPGPEWLPFRNQAALSDGGLRKKYREQGVSHPRWPLKPGQAFKDHFELNKLYVMPLAGKYRVAFSFHAPDSVGKGLEIESNEVVFTILAKE